MYLHFFQHFNDLFIYVPIVIEDKIDIKELKRFALEI